MEVVNRGREKQTTEAVSRGREKQTTEAVSRGREKQTQVKRVTETAQKQRCHTDTEQRAREATLQQSGAFLELTA